MPAGLTRKVAVIEVVDAGDAWFDARTGTGEGRVAAVFRHAAYLRFGTRLLALCPAEVDAGPLHLRLDRLPALAAELRATLSEGHLAVGPVDVGLGEEHRWRPVPVDGAALRAAPAPTPAPGAAADAGLPADVVAEAARLVERGDLTGLARAVGGRGPGLTPAGDDVLAGVLVADAALRPRGGDARDLAAATASAATTDVAAAFLRWAARGRCIQPVHDVLAARAAGRVDAEAEARLRLRRVGASSGAALLLGLDLALFTETQR